VRDAVPMAPICLAVEVGIMAATLKAMGAGVGHCEEKGSLARGGWVIVGL
jgi:hypothetical protein